MCDDRRWDGLEGDVKACIRVLNEYFSDVVRAGHITILLSDDHELQKLNRQFRGKDTPTNVLSFPAVDDGIAVPELSDEHLGDIAISFDRCKDEAMSGSIPLAHHVRHLVIHGTLHVFGHDHQNEDEAKVMESLETRILEKMSIPDPYQDNPVEFFS